MNAVRVGDIRDQALLPAFDGVFITSWNKWHGGTEIEPSVEHGYDALDETGIQVEKWMKKRLTMVMGTVVGLYGVDLQVPFDHAIASQPVVLDGVALKNA